MEMIEIRKVNNGYTVMPTYYNQGRITEGKEINVFETFDALVAFLKTNFQVAVAINARGSDENA